MAEQIETLIQKWEKTIAVLIAIQHSGQASLKEIKDYLDHIKVDLQLRSVAKHCKILQNKGLISSNYRPTEQGQELVYNMQKGYVKFPEIAQIKDVVKFEGLQMYIDKLENIEGAKKEKNKFLNYLCSVKWKVTDGVAGFYPNADGINCHYRKGKDIIFFPNHFRKYITKNLSKADKSQYIVDHFGFDYGKATLNGSPMYVDSHFVMVRGDIREQSGGAGLKGIEILPENSTIETNFVIPAKEFKPEEFKKFLEKIGKYGNCGFGAYASRWGKLELIDFKVLKEDF